MPGRDSRQLRSHLAAIDPELPLRVWPDYGNPNDITATVTWNHPGGSLALFPNLQLIHSYGAGVDHILSDASLPTDIPICRVVDPGLAEQMRAYVHACLLEKRFSLSNYRDQQSAGLWRPLEQARGNHVGLLGLGQLGTAVARYLRDCGYHVTGWSRTRKTLPEIECLTGPEGLDRLLPRCDYLVCLLPLTPETRGMLNSTLFAKMKPSAHLINVGRGGHLDEPDLITALERGVIAGATLDVVSEEPLPREHPLWRTRNLTITPHISSISDPAVVAAQVVENLRRSTKGAPLLNSVDRARAY